MSSNQHMLDSASPRLPPELERYIFELSAMAHKTSIPQLLRVAHRVHVWIEPVLYHTIILQGPDERRPFRTEQYPRSPADFRHAAFLASHVHHLNLSGAVPHDQLRTLLGVCTSIRTLALWSPLPRPPNLLSLLQALPLMTRLSADITHLCGGPLRLDLSHPAFASLTHLDVLAAPFDDWRLCSGIARAPALTHLTFRDKFHPKVLRGALAHCCGLRALGVIWSAKKGAADVREGVIVDARMFMAICGDRLEDWEAGVRGEKDIWAKAEAFIAKKKAGEIKVVRLWV
ncbi:hypothetical protein K438DRAFT_1987230 [Mycena galopus ATCC 62051]|nr:hypothetical protein K438DRAFT_1987230 [Mycena galopus ATCC 62051]